VYERAFNDSHQRHRDSRLGPVQRSAWTETNDHGLGAHIQLEQLLERHARLDDAAMRAKLGDAPDQRRLGKRVMTSHR
jgi:hypothetical protein